MDTTARMQEVGQRMEQLPRGVSRIHPNQSQCDGFRVALPILRAMLQTIGITNVKSHESLL